MTVSPMEELFLHTRNTVPIGTGFFVLWTASAISTIGDGVTMAAGPLLVASLTSSASAVAGVAFVQQLPWLLFALVSGAFVDRLDRRRLIVTVDLLRAAALSVLVVAAAIATVTVPIVYAVFFLLGIGETLAGTASAALLPAVVPAARLGDANARLMATFTIGNQILAKPLGAWLFVIGAAAPFGLEAVSFVVAAALVATMRGAGARTVPRAGVSVRADVAEGVRWLWRHGLLRTLAVSMGSGMSCSARRSRRSCSTRVSVSERPASDMGCCSPRRRSAGCSALRRHDACKRGSRPPFYCVLDSWWRPRRTWAWHWSDRRWRPRRSWSCSGSTPWCGVSSS